MKRREFIRSTGGTFFFFSNIFSVFKKKNVDTLVQVWKVATYEKGLPQPDQKEIKELFEKIICNQYYFVKDTFKMGTKLLDILPFFYFKFKRFSNMNLDEAREFFLSLKESGIPQIRGLYLTLKSVALFLYYSRPESWDYIGYEGPWVEK